MQPSWNILLLLSMPAQIGHVRDGVAHSQPAKLRNSNQMMPGQFLVAFRIQVVESGKKAKSRPTSGYNLLEKKIIT